MNLRADVIIEIVLISGLVIAISIFGYLIYRWTILNDGPTITMTATVGITPTPTLFFPPGFISTDELQELLYEREINEELGHVVALEGPFYGRETIFCFYRDGLVATKHLDYLEAKRVNGQKICADLESEARRHHALSKGYYTRINKDIEFYIYQGFALNNRVMYYTGTVEMKKDAAGRDLETVTLKSFFLHPVMINDPPDRNTDRTLADRGTIYERMD